MSHDAEGFITVRDRLKDVIKSGGEWISSVALENLIVALPDVAEVAVIAVPDARWGERPLAVVVSALGTTATLKSLESAVRATVDAAIARGELSRVARIDQESTVDALPRTSVGKIDKKQLRARFGHAPA